MRLRTRLSAAGLCIFSLAAHADTYSIYAMGASSGNIDNVGFTNGGQSFVLALPSCSKADSCYQTFTPPAGHQDSATEPSLDAGDGSWGYTVDLTPGSGPNTSLSVVNNATGVSTAIYTGNIGDWTMNSFGDVAFMIYNDPAASMDDVNALAVNETAHAAITPEPSSFALLGTGLLGVAGLIRRRVS